MADVIPAIQINATPNIPFISNPIVEAAILGLFNAINDAAFIPPYAGNLQPIDNTDAQNDIFVQFQLPGGASLKSYADNDVKSFASHINSVLGIFAPFMSAYAMILPILGIIKGILEVICALLNPFAVVKAVVRLFEKYIPPFLSLLPPMAGIIMVLNIIKIIIAIALFVLTVVWPMVELIIVNIQELKVLIANNEKLQSQTAIVTKLQDILVELLNQLGVISVIQPILQIIALILDIAGGIPCKPGQKKSSATPSGLITTQQASFNPNTDDSSCCSDDTCPPILNDPPSGTGEIVVSPATYNLTLKLLTNDPTVSQIVKYYGNTANQLNRELSNTINDPTPAGGTGSSSTLNVQITNARGMQAQVPILGFPDGYNIWVPYAPLSAFVGPVSWQIVPDFDILIFKNIIGLGCHPTVAAARNAMDGYFPDLEQSVANKFPDAGNVVPDYTNYASTINNIIRNQLPTLVSNLDDTGVNNARTTMVNLTNALVNNFQGKFSRIASSAADILNSGATFRVNPSIVKVGDSSTISIQLIDTTGVNLLASAPPGANPNVSFETDFGTIFNQTVNIASGVVSAQITANSIGNANVKASINGVFVQDLINNEKIDSIRVVQFVADAELPTRRKEVSLTAEKPLGVK